MRVILQRVAHARVSVGAKTVGAIGPGLCLLLGIGKDDSERDAELLAEKILKLRVFDDEQGKMNRSIVDCRGAILVVSQFTLYGDWRKGNRPSFSLAAPAEMAERLYRYFVERWRAGGILVATGEFQARMEVTLANDGPVTFVLESSP